MTTSPKAREVSKHVHQANWHGLSHEEMHLLTAKTVQSAVDPLLELVSQHVGTHCYCSSLGPKNPYPACLSCRVRAAIKPWTATHPLLLEDYDSIKFSCGHHALSGSVLEHARALLEERERQK